MALPVLDLHVHVLALDPADSDGGFFSPARKRSLAVRWIRRVASLPRRDEGFDKGFRRLLADQIGVADALSRNDGCAGFRAVGLAFDMPHDANGNPDSDLADFYTPDSYVFRLAEGGGLGRGSPATSGMLPGASIHPFRSDAAEALTRAVERGAVLVKWLPTAQNIDPADPRSVAFAGECRRLHIPLLVHTGSEAATRNAHPEWNNPRSLEPLLSTGVVVIAAHAGMRSLPHEPCHFREWIAMLRDWPNLYGDTASLFGFRPRTLTRALDKPLVAERLVHGSDWPVPNWPGWYWPGLSYRAVKQLARIANPFWRDVATKRAAGLPDEALTRGWSLLKTRNGGSAEPPPFPNK